MNGHKLKWSSKRVIKYFHFPFHFFLPFFRTTSLSLFLPHSVHVNSLIYIPDIQLTLNSLLVFLVNLARGKYFIALVWYNVYVKKPFSKKKIWSVKCTSARKKMCACLNSNVLRKLPTIFTWNFSERDTPEKGRNKSKQMYKF